MATTAVLAAATGTVSVRYDHPENFTGTREVRAFTLSRADDGPAAGLPATARHHGSYLPLIGPAQPVRIVKDIHPPRIDLHLHFTDASGNVLNEGTHAARPGLPLRQR